MAVAATLDGALLNAPGTMAVNFPVADGGSFVLFAADYLEGGVPGGQYAHAHGDLLGRLHRLRVDHGTRGADDADPGLQRQAARPGGARTRRPWARRGPGRNADSHAERERGPDGDGSSG